MANGVSRLKVAKVTQSGAKGKALADEINREMNVQDPTGESCEEAGIKGEKSHGTHSRK